MVALPYRSAAFAALLLATAAAGCSASDPAPEGTAAPAENAESALFLGDRAPTFASPAAAPAAPTCTGKQGRPLFGTRKVTVTVGGRERSATIKVPPSYDKKKGIPVVLTFHGVDFGAFEHEILTGLDKESDDDGFLLVYPQGYENSWNAGTCCGTADDDGIDDVAFVNALLDKLEADYCVDENRVFASGFSNGGFFSYRLACELSDCIAAAVSVSGTIAVDASTCNPARPMPVLHIHGTADTIVPYLGGVGTKGPGVLASVADAVSMVRENSGCAATSRAIYTKGDATCVTYDGCSAGADVTLCTVEEGGHTWPGGLWLPSFLAGKVSYDLDASKALSRFFAAHPKAG